jgi:energy-coupling factor transporter ATP-binding protein EcfA2
LSNKSNETEAVKLINFNYKYENNFSFNDNINLSIADNDFTAIIGRNGCGKTTLLKCITGLLLPAVGEIYIRGKNSKELSAAGISREIGFVMQNPDYQLFSNTVYSEVSFALKNSRLPENIIRQRTEEALFTVGLKDHSAFPHSLPRSDRIKTVLASVLAMGCKIIILDEAEVGQDYLGSLEIMNILVKLHAQGYTIIFVTHNMFLAAEYSQRLIEIGKEGILIDGKTDKVFIRKRV